MNPPPVAPFTTSESPAVVDLDTVDIILTLPHSAPGSFIMNRSFRQARLTTGKLAYVIFGSLEDSGVYYNWLVFSLIPLLLSNSSLQAIG